MNTLVTLLASCLHNAVESNEILGEGHYERVFLYALSWSVGGLLGIEDRKVFDRKLRQLSDNMPESDGQDGIFEFLVNEENTQWEHWSGHVPTWEYPADVESPKFASLVIPTMDSVRLEALLRLVFVENGATLLVRKGANSEGGKQTCA